MPAHHESIQPGGLEAEEEERNSVPSALPRSEGARPEAAGLAAR